MSGNVVALLYLVAGILFILALRGLSNPETSRQGNLFGMTGMAIAIATTLAASPPAGMIDPVAPHRRLLGPGRSATRRRCW